MKKRILMSWSSGKDSAWALQQLLANPDYEVVGLFTTISEEFDRVAMHGVRTTLLRQQAAAIGLPLTIISLPNPCTNDIYHQRMACFIQQAKTQGVTAMAFGDLLLEDVREYREKQLKSANIAAIFPIWGTDTHQLPKQMFAAGLRTIITCLDPNKVPMAWAGKELTPELLANLPNEVDPCGENGEFHTFVFDCPLFKQPIDIKIGDNVSRNGLIFTDLLPT
ncbi:MAG: ATP-binding protein [Oceanisphaera sp.]